MPVTAEHAARSPVVLPSQRGAGMTEYLIILGAISLAAVGTFAAFGDTVRSQTAAAALELAGMDSSQAIQRVRENASRTVDAARKGGPFFGQVGGAGDSSGGGSGSFDPTLPFEPPGGGKPPFDPPSGGWPPLEPPGGGMCPAGGIVIGVASACEEQEMVLSARGETWLKTVEKLALYPYDDQKGISHRITEWVEGATIGYGHLIAEYQWNTFKDGITREEAEMWFEEDVAPFIEVVNGTIDVELTQSEFDALVILAYNIGEDGFRSSSAVRLINNPQAKTPYSSLQDAWMAWNRSQGRVNRGLINRRRAEWDMYSMGVYRYW